MRREFVEASKIDVFTPNELKGKSGCHFPDEEGNLVRINVSRDGKTLEQHFEGIAYFEKLSRNGVKIFPPLVQRLSNGRFQEMDGFKRILGMKNGGQDLIECFVFDSKDKGKSFNYDGKKMTCKRGGQPTTRFPPVEYGEDHDQQRSHGKIINLYVGKDLKIEYRENLHVHWGPRGRNRLALGRRDFELLALAVIGDELG